MAKFHLLGRDASTGQLKYPESVNLNVMDYGAFNDGTSASTTTTAITNAISDAAASGGQKVYLPAGTYLVNSTINVPGGVTLYGDGAEKTIISSSTNQIILNLIEGSGAYATLGPKIRDIQILGSTGVGSNQIGVKVDDDLYISSSEVRDVRILNCGSHGLYVGKTFSSRFINIFSSNTTGYPFLIDCANMPSNHFESLYAGDVRSGVSCGFRVRSGNVRFRTCNGINSSPSGSYWAVVGDVTGYESDGLSTNSTCSLTLDDCNIESSKGGGILSIANSILDFAGENKFAGDSSGSGTYKAIAYDMDLSLYPYPTLLSKGTLEDRVVFANGFYEALTGTVAINGTVNVVGTSTNFTSLVSGQLVYINGETRKVNVITDNTHFSVTQAFTGTASGLTANKIYYAEGEVIHSDYFPPLKINGNGPKISGAEFQYKYYNSTNSRSEYLYRTDTTLAREIVSSNATYVNPGIKIFEINAGSNVALTIPWAGWYKTPETIFLINKSANGVVATISADSSGTIGGNSSLILDKKYQYVQLTSNGTDWEYIYLSDEDKINVKTYGAKGNNSTDDTTAVSNAVTAAYATARPLYFPSGTYLIDTLVIPTNSLIVYGDGEGKTVLKSHDSTKAVIDINSTSVVIHSITLRDFSIECAGTGSNNHGIYIHGTNEVSNLTVRNVRISNCTGSGIYATNSLFSELYESIDISMASGGSHAIDITGSADCTFLRCYVHTVGTSKAAYRVRSGTPVFIGCNGIDSGSTCLWGLFGNNTAEDGLDSYVRATFIGTNIEDFTDTGIRFKAGSTGSFIGSTIIAPAAGPVKALVFDFVDSNLAGMFDSGSSITSKGAGWTNSEPVHSSGLPFIQIGNRELTTYRDTNVGASTSIPGIVGTLLAGTTDYALTISGVGRITDRLLFNEIASSATPPANSVSLYAKDVSGTSKLFLKDDGGTEVQIGGGSSGISWSEVTGTTQTMTINTAYVANNASRVVFTLPSTASVGSVVRVSGKGAGGWRIAQNTSGITHFGNLDSTTGTGGYIESTHIRDAVELVCVVANLEWNVISSMGNIAIV